MMRSLPFVATIGKDGMAVGHFSVTFAVTSAHFLVPFRQVSLKSCSLPPEI